MACKKRQGYLHSEITNQNDRQLHLLRRTKQLEDRIDMLKLRQTEQRNIVNRRIEAAKVSCELSVREAAKVVVAAKRIEMLKAGVKGLEDKIFDKRKEITKLKQSTKEKEFDLERAKVQRSVKTMKKERDWHFK